MKKIYLPFLILMFLSNCVYGLTIHTIGDSTMEHKDPATTENGQRGWAQMLNLFVTNGATVNNRAKSGTSSMTFYEQEDANGNKRFWATVKPQIKKGDYVLIQFGHNDEKHGGEEGEIGTNPWQSYTLYLTRYVNEVRELEAIPVLLTPIVRNQFGADGKITAKGAHNLGMGADEKQLDYPGAMKKVAEDLNCLLVDHTALTKSICEEYGAAKVTELIYNVGDGTHIGEYGATLYARLAVQQMIRQGILAEYLNADPDLLVTPQSHDFGKCYVNTISTYPFSVSGMDLTPATGKVTVTASTGFSVSHTLNGTYQQSIDIDYTNGNLAITNFYVKYAPETEGKNTGQITLTYSNNNTKIISLSGEGVSFSNGQKATVYWELSKDESYTVDGAVTVIPEVFSNMYPARYAAPGSPTTWVGGLLVDGTKTQRNIISGDKWPPGEIDIVHDRFIQFGVTATKGTVFNVDSIGLYVGGSGTNGMRFRVLCSKDLSFSDPIMIADRQTNTSNTMYPISYSNIIELHGEESLYVRVYPWLNNGADSKSICLYGVTIKGVITDAIESSIRTQNREKSALYCFPSVTNNVTTLHYTLNTDSDVKIQLYSVDGKQISTLQKGTQPQGAYQEVLDLSGLNAGVYLCSVMCDKSVNSMRIIKK